MASSFTLSMSQFVKLCFPTYTLFLPWQRLYSLFLHQLIIRPSHWVSQEKLSLMWLVCQCRLCPWWRVCLWWFSLGKVPSTGELWDAHYIWNPEHTRRKARITQILFFGVGDYYPHKQVPENIHKCKEICLGKYFKGKTMQVICMQPYWCVKANQTRKIQTPAEGRAGAEGAAASPHTNFHLLPLLNFSDRFKLEPLQ